MKNVFDLINKNKNIYKGKGEGPFDQRKSYLGTYSADFRGYMAVTMSFDFNSLEWNRIDFELYGTR